MPNGDEIARETLMRSADGVCSDPKGNKPLSGSVQANHAGGLARNNRALLSLGLAH